MKIILVALGLALLSATAAQAIDCAKASTDLEHAICNNPDLLEADDAMNAAYQSALKAVGPKMTKALKADAASWAESRYDNCATDQAGDPSRPEDIISCLVTDTRHRTAFLSGMPLEGPGFGEPMLPQVMVGADGVINEYVRFAAPFVHLRKAFNAALDNDDEAEVKHLLHLLEAHTSTVVMSADLERMVAFRGVLARVRDPLELRDTPLAREAVASLYTLRGVLDSSANAARMAGEARRRSEARAVLRDRVCAELRRAQSLRSGELAERLATDPSQISRVLRTLQDDGMVRQVEARPSGDRRAKRYALVTAA